VIVSTPQITLAVQPIALRREQAAAVLGLSVDAFDEHVRAEVKAIRKGRLVLFPVEELQRWAQRNAATVLEGSP
jgi:hypothetical protein